MLGGAAALIQHSSAFLAVLQRGIEAGHGEGLEHTAPREAMFQLCPLFRTLFLHFASHCEFGAAAVRASNPASCMDGAAPGTALAMQHTETEQNLQLVSRVLHPSPTFVLPGSHPEQGAGSSLLCHLGTRADP